MKPQSPGVPIRWSHPLAVGLVRAWVFNGRRGRDSSGWTFRDAVAGDVSTYTRNNADTVWTNGPAGPAFQSGADGGVATWRTTQTLSSWGPGMTARSLSVVGRIQKFGSNPNLESVGGTGSSILLSTRRAAGDVAGFVLYSTAAAFRFAADGSGLLVGATEATAPSLGVWYTLGGTYVRNTATATYGGTWTVYRDGLPRASNNLNIAGSFGGTFTDNIPTFNADAGTLATSDKRFDYLYVWSRALSPSEVAWVTDAPYDIFAQRRGWSVGADSGAAAPNISHLVAGGRLLW